MERRRATRAAAQRDAPASEVTATPTGERVAPEPQFPHGMRNAAAAYASSASTDVAAYEDLPGHHLLAVRNLIATRHLARVRGVGLLRRAGPSDVPRFLDVADYWFGCSDDSSAEIYDPARECFMVTIGDLVDDTSVVGAGDEEAPQNSGTSILLNPGPSAPPTSPARGADINAQLAQARELEAKLAEEYRAVRLLRTSIAGEASAHGERVRELGKQSRERINADFNVNDPNTPSRESEAHHSCNAAPGHARALDAQGAKPAALGAGAYRASGRATGRKLGVRHTPAGQRAGRRRHPGPRGGRPPRWCGRATGLPGPNAGQGADP
jgi:hypothetical protein